ncbi:MAG: trypsin-like peptidase domain-containing protein [Prevotella sp.]|nr:trypsin-like peptidase domain-containing protein [Prevotella sp.]
MFVKIKNSLRYLTILISIGYIFTLSSCVTLLGKKQEVSLNSYPQGAHVYAGNKYVGTTPCSYKSKKTKDFTFKKEGYQSTTINADTKMRGSIWWNLLFTGFIGVLVDLPYWDKYDGLYYYANLNPAPVKKAETPKPSIVTPSAPKEMAASSSTLSRIEISYSNIELKAQNIYQKYKSAVFMIYTSNERSISQGSGFFVSKDGIAISNYHVFKGTLRGKETIKLSTGTTYKIKEVLAYSEEYDYFVFKVDGNNFNYIPVTKKGYSIGETVYAIGSPRELENTFSNGIVSQNRGKYIQISVPIDYGSSGGALINSYGEVIGITSGGRDDSGANLNYAVDIRNIFNQTSWKWY